MEESCLSGHSYFIYFISYLALLVKYLVFLEILEEKFMSMLNWTTFVQN